MLSRLKAPFLSRTPPTKRSQTPAPPKTARQPDLLSSVDLSWAKGFHTVSITRWSEPPGPEGFECYTWRVLVGAFGRYVSSNHQDLQVAIASALQKAAEDPKLRDACPSDPSQRSAGAPAKG